MNLLRIYLRDIGPQQPLTEAQELFLAERAREGDHNARQQLIQSHLLLVVNIARRYARPGIDIMDLLQEGNIGLIRAVDEYDPSLGNRLNTLARYWAEKYILRFLRDEVEINISLDTEIISSEENLLLSDTIEDQDTLLGCQTFKTIEQIIDLRELQEHVQHKLALLPPNEQQVIKLLYGLDGYPKMTIEQISQYLGIHQKSICRIKSKAIRKLKSMGI